MTAYARVTQRWVRTMARVRIVACMAACAVAFLGSLMTPRVLAAQPMRSSRRVPTAQTRPIHAPALPLASTTADTTPPAFPVSIRVSADTVTVGDPFTMTAMVDVPVGSTVQWPSITDTAASVSMRAAVRVTSEPHAGMRRETAEYALAAWDVGVLSIALGDVVVRGASDVQKVSLRSARIAVKTVLPLDTALHVPKPARDLFPRAVPWWEVWWPAAAVVAALALLVWYWRRRRRTIVKREAPPLDVYAKTLLEFDRLQRLGLADGGEGGRAVALAVEVLRTYLAVRLPDASMSRTSSELLAAADGDARVPRERLSALLANADRIKFARRPLAATEARALHDEARALVEYVELRDVARRKVQDDLRKARERDEREAKQRDEDAARKRSTRSTAGAA